MRGYLGLSVGATNLVAVADRAPIVRRSVLTLFEGRRPEVGVVGGDGLVITGFVERVGDPIPLLAADGSAHRGEQLLAAAVESLMRAASPAQRPERTVVAVPAHWGSTAFDAARAALPGVRVVPDAVAALTAIQKHPGLSARGVVALADFGATGTSLTLADSGARFAPIGQTVRYDDFSGDLVDQELLRHVLSSLDAEASGTAAVAALSRLREESRAAKERLSYQASTGLPGPAPGSMLRLTRAELEAVVDAPLRGVIEALHDLLRRNGVHPAQLTALVTVGGAARIPLVTQRFSEAFRMPVTTVAQAQVVTAVGAGLLAHRGEAETAATRRAVIAPSSPTGTVAASALAPAPLAWSVSDSAAEVMDYIPESVSEDSARPAFTFAEPEVESAEACRTPWYRGVLVCAAALLAVVGTVGLLLSARADKMDAAPASSPAAPGLTPAEAPLAQVGAAPPTRTVVVQNAPAQAVAPAPAPVVSPSSAPYSVQRQQVASAPAPQAVAAGPPPAADPPPADIPAPAAVPPAPELPPIPQLPIPALPLPQLPIPQLPIPTFPASTPPRPPTHTPTPTPEPTRTQTPTPEPTHTQAPEPAPQPSSAPQPSHSTEPTTSAVPTP